VGNVTFDISNGHTAGDTDYVTATLDGSTVFSSTGNPNGSFSFPIATPGSHTIVFNLTSNNSFGSGQISVDNISVPSSSSFFYIAGLGGVGGGGSITTAIGSTSVVSRSLSGLGSTGSMGSLSYAATVIRSLTGLGGNGSYSNLTVTGNGPVSRAITGFGGKGNYGSITATSGGGGTTTDSFETDWSGWTVVNYVVGSFNGEVGSATRQTSFGGADGSYYAYLTSNDIYDADGQDGLIIGTAITGISKTVTTGSTIKLSVAAGMVGFVTPVFVNGVDKSVTTTVSGVWEEKTITVTPGSNTIQIKSPTDSSLTVYVDKIVY
jgi:hypothetical protein